ncbi:MAG TPA: amidohydrolase family protein [Acidimicrobiales bacterium]|nr:amidohydrolase family protein [Acidimicrobiales bacterium]
MIVDSHVHVATTDDRYPVAPTGIGTDWWKEPDHDAESFVGAMDQAGVDQAVLVQAVGPYSFDNRYVVAASSAHPGRLAAVVAVDLDAADHLAHLEELAVLPAVTGVRLFGMTTARRWIGRGGASTVLETAARLGLTAVVTVTADAIAPLRPAFAAAECPVVLDHCGFPAFEDGRIAPGEPVLGLAELDRIHLKVTTHTFQHADGDPAAVVDQLVGLFGPGRLLWGSDHPQTFGGLGAAVETARQGVRRLAVEDQARFLGATTADLFGLDRGGAELPPGVHDALDPLARSLAADGYRLDVVAIADGRARLDVRAGEGACDDCLVPKEVFVGIAANRLERAGIELALEVSYPVDVP